MRVAALQYDISTQPEQNWAFIEAELDRAVEHGIDFVLLPEMWVSSFPSSRSVLLQRAEEDRRWVDRLRAKSDSLGIGVGGSALAPHGSQVLNRLEFFDRGESVFCYDKIHLFTPTAEHEIFSAGAKAPSVVEIERPAAPGRRAEEGEECQRIRLSGGVCYDLRFPDLFRVPFRDGVQLLCVSAQWPVPRELHWESLAIARAIENQCFLLASNRTGKALIGRRQKRLVFPGNSMVVSPYGEVLAKGAGQSGLVQAEIELSEVREFRLRVPIIKDERRELYRDWLDPDRPAATTYSPKS